MKKMMLYTLKIAMEIAYGAFNTVLLEVPLFSFFETALLAAMNTTRGAAAAGPPPLLERMI